MFQFAIVSCSVVLRRNARPACYPCFMLLLEREQSAKIRVLKPSTYGGKMKFLSALACSLFALAVLTANFFSAASAADQQKPGNSLAKPERAMFAMGCFWKTQYIFSKTEGVVRTRVGYSGGNVKSPSYEQVCSHTTGHAETVLVEYDPTKVTYMHLLEVFFSKHDPTTLNRQGPDEGSNYRSVIFYTTPAQKQEATDFKKQLEASHKFKKAIVTSIEPAGPFYDAEEYHQNYFATHGQVCE